MILKLFLRIIAILCLAGNYSHQLYAVSEVFGWNLLSASFLATVFCFYSFTYCSQFHPQFKLVGPKATGCQHQCHRLQWLLLGLNMALILFDAYLRAQHLSVKDMGKLGFESTFLIFGEYFVFLLAQMFEDE